LADQPKRDEYTSFIFAMLRQVQADPKTSAMEFRLAYVLSQMLNRKTRACFPLQSTLAERLGVTDRTVRSCVAGLVGRGHLRVRHRGGDNSSLYEFVRQDRNDVSGLSSSRQEASFRSPPNRDRKSDAGRPEIPRRKTGSQLPTEPTSEPTERGAPQARPRRAPSEWRESRGRSDGSVGAVAPPPVSRQRPEWPADNSDVPF
jgi:hypothetical protein